MNNQKLGKRSGIWEFTIIVVSMGPGASTSKYKMFLMIFEVLLTYFYTVKSARSGRIRVCIEKKWIYKVSDGIQNVSWVFSNFFPLLKLRFQPGLLLKYVLYNLGRFFMIFWVYYSFKCIQQESILKKLFLKWLLNSSPFFSKTAKKQWWLTYFCSLKSYINCTQPFRTGRAQKEKYSRKLRNI